MKTSRFGASLPYQLGTTTYGVDVNKVLAKALYATLQSADKRVVQFAVRFRFNTNFVDVVNCSHKENANFCSPKKNTGT